MTIIKDKNFAGVATAQIPKADEYHNCNFSQVNINIPLFPSDPTPRKFVQCNMINCVPPAGSEMIDCNTAVVQFTGQSGVHTVLGRRAPDGTYEEFPTPIEIDERGQP